MNTAGDESNRAPVVNPHVLGSFSIDSILSKGKERSEPVVETDHKAKPPEKHAEKPSSSSEMTSGMLIISRTFCTMILRTLC